jgi:hypothetical protein
MNTYICFFKRQQVEVEAETSLAAQKAAALKFIPAPKRVYEVTVKLAAVAGEPVTHVADF